MKPAAVKTWTETDSIWGQINLTEYDTNAGKCILKQFEAGINFSWENHEIDSSIHQKISHKIQLSKKLIPSDKIGHTLAVALFDGYIAYTGLQKKRIAARSIELLGNLPSKAQAAETDRILAEANDYYVNSPHQGWIEALKEYL